MYPEQGPSLTGADLYHWVALRRVSNGGITKLGERWLDHGAPVPGYLTAALTELSELALVTLVHPASGGASRVVLTAAGTDRFEQFCQVALGLSAAQFMAFYHRAGADEPDN